MKIYISAPVTGYEFQERKFYFMEIARRLHHKGFDFVNPMFQAKEHTPREKWMRKDLRYLIDCDAILLLDNWTKSEGCKVEYQVAKACGMKIYTSVEDIK